MSEVARLEIKVTSNTSSAVRSLAALDANLRRVASSGGSAASSLRGVGNSANQNSSAQDRSARSTDNNARSMNNLSGGSQKASVDMRSLLISMAIVASTSLAPVLVASAGGLLALGAAASSVGLGLGVFGLALKAIGTNKDGTLVAFDGMRAAITKWGASMKGITMKPIEAFTKMLPGALKMLNPMLKTTADMLTKGVHALEGWLKSKEAATNIKKLTDAFKPLSSNLGGAIGNFLRGIINLFVAFLPTSVKMTGGLKSLSDSFLKWSQTLDKNQGFQKFIKYVEKEGPIVWGYLGKIVVAVTKFVVALLPLGTLVLGGLVKFIQLIGNLDPAVITGIATAVTGLVLAIKGAQIIGAAAAAIGAIGVTATLVGAAVLALGILFVVLFMKCKPFHDFVMNKLIPGLKSFWDLIWSNVKPALEAIWAAIQTHVVPALKSLWTSIQLAWQKIQPFVLLVERIYKVELLGWKTVMVYVVIPAIGLLIRAIGFLIVGLSTMIGWVASFINYCIDHFIPAMKRIGDFFVAVWHGIYNTFNTITSSIRNFLYSWLKNIEQAWSIAWNWVKNAAVTVWHALNTAWQNSLNAIKNAWNTVSTWVKSNWNDFWFKLKLAAEKIWLALKSGWSTFINGLKSAWDKVSSALRGAFSSLWDNIKKDAKKLWDGIVDIFKAPIKLVIGVWNTVAKVFGLSEAHPKGFATGGHVAGPGGPTGDKIPAMLSDGEYVMNAASVRHYGMQNMHAMNARRLATGGPANPVPASPTTPFNPYAVAPSQNNKIPKSGGGFFSTLLKLGKDAISLPAKALGALKNAAATVAYDVAKPVLDGIVGAVPYGDAGHKNSILGMPHNLAAKAETSILSIFKSKQDAAKAAAAASAATAGSGSDSAALAWAKTQQGLPYQWGGNGNPSWDCSGYMSAIESVIRGEKPHRRWATMSFNGATAAPGWVQDLKAPFMIGITDAGVGHTAGTLNGTNVECRGGNGCLVGGSARGYNDPLFKWHYGFQPSIGAAATAPGAGGGGGSGQWDSIVKQALAMAGLGPNLAAQVEKQIQTESGGNPNAQNNTDYNAQHGMPSQGLLQVIPPTFAAYAGSLAGRGIRDPLANIYAAIQYAKSTYGPTLMSGGSGLGSGSAYRLGGMAKGMSLVGENGPEIIDAGSGSRVYTNKQSREMLGGDGSAGGGDVIINVENMYGTPQDAAEVAFRVRTHGMGFRTR